MHLAQHNKYLKLYLALIRGSLQRREANMKKIVVLLLVVGLVVAWTVTGEATVVEKPEYVVQSGDTLWWLQGYYGGDPTLWRRIVDENPFLKEPGRIYEKDGMTIALIRPGEKLQGLEKLGILPRTFPISALQVAVAPMAAPTNLSWNPWPWLWVLALAATLLVIAVVVYWLRRSVANQATAGEPIVAGGIPPTAPDAVEARFEQMAQRRLGDLNPTANLATDQPQRIGEVESGFLSGVGMVRYRDRSEQRRLNREPAYRARFRFPDGHEEELFFLQRCANDVTFYGARYAGFTFDPSGAVVPAPSSPIPEPAPATVVRPLRVAASGEPVRLTTVTVGRLELTVPEGSTVRVGGNRIALSVPAACDLAVSFAEAKKANRPKVVKPAAAAS